MNRTRRTEEGFTLISVMIAVSMLTIGLLALARSQTSLTKAQGGTSMRAVAYGIARSYAEDVRGRPATAIVTESATLVDNQGIPSGTGVYTRSMIVSSDSPRLYRVTIQVAYPQGTQPVQLVTLIFR